MAKHGAVEAGPRDGCQGIGPFIPTVKLRLLAGLAAAGARFLVFVLFVSEAHNCSHVRRHPLESVAEYGLPRARRPAVPTRRPDGSQEGSGFLRVTAWS